MSQLELYRGYRWLMEQLYDFRRYRERTLAFLLERGHQVHRGANIRKGDLKRLARILRENVSPADPRRAWFTLSLLAATLLSLQSLSETLESYPDAELTPRNTLLDDLVGAVPLLVAFLQRRLPVLGRLPRGVGAHRLVPRPALVGGHGLLASQVPVPLRRS